MEAAEYFKIYKTENQGAGKMHLILAFGARGEFGILCGREGENIGSWEGQIEDLGKT